ncbi:DUF998 domain-containing protein [Enemella evansiae]|uniref:DUF998 domain-containing protein n=1 Tax=Enemella evansiae TaxID=2016499 RepID=UPI001060BDBA|nr:DUF998 domain-containing protein [Enemella evansiae]TDO93561.1 putative membrane protein [Enemella evansiae]
MRTPGLLWIAAPLWYVLCEAIAASAFPGYSYATFYISDLGVPEIGDFQGRSLDSPLHAVMNAGFLGTGLLFFLGLALLTRTLPRGLATGALVVLGAVHTVGISLVGLVPGSMANLANGLIRFHAIGAIAAIAGGNLAAIVSARPLRRLGRWRFVGPILGGLGLVCGVLLSLHVGFPDGVWERGAVYPFMAWQLLTGIALWRLESATSPVDGPEIATLRS